MTNTLCISPVALTGTPPLEDVCEIPACMAEGVAYLAFEWKARECNGTFGE